MYPDERLEMTPQEKYTEAKTRKRKNENKNLKTNMQQRIDRDGDFNRCVFLRLGSSARTNYVRTNHPGAWRTMVTPVNCQTGDPLGPPFREPADV